MARRKKPTICISISETGHVRRMDRSDAGKIKRKAIRKARSARLAAMPEVDAYSPIIDRAEARNARMKAERIRTKVVTIALKDPMVDGTGPTALTKGKHRKTSFEVMHDRGEITGPMYEAAQEIERVYMAICGAVMCRGMPLAPTSKGEPVPMAEKIAWAHAKRFKPWADRLSARKNGGGPPALEIVIDVVVDGRVVTDIDTEHRWRRGYAKHLTRRSLLEYAEMAGWAKKGEVLEFDRTSPQFVRRYEMAA